MPVTNQSQDSSIHSFFPFHICKSSWNGSALWIYERYRRLDQGCLLLFPSWLGMATLLIFLLVISVTDQDGPSSISKLELSSFWSLIAISVVKQASLLLVSFWDALAELFKFYMKQYVTPQGSSLLLFILTSRDQLECLSPLSFKNNMGHQATLVLFCLLPERMARPFVICRIMICLLFWATSWAGQALWIRREL